MKYLAIAILLLMAGCASNVGKAQCDSSTSHTVLDGSEFHILIYNPDSEVDPEVWEGPICAQAKQRNTVCHFSESLISAVQFSDSETLVVTTFSGSNSKKWVFNLASCEVGDLSRQEPQKSTDQQ
jgi:hypothetical protein